MFIFGLWLRPLAFGGCAFPPVSGWRGRQCSLASRRQVWCLLSAAIRPPVSPVFGLWRVRFPPCLVRPGRRLPVQGLSVGSLGRGPGPGSPLESGVSPKGGHWHEGLSRFLAMM